MCLNRMNKALIFCIIRIIRSPVGRGGGGCRSCLFMFRHFSFLTRRIIHILFPWRSFRVLTRFHLFFLEKLLSDLAIPKYNQPFVFPVIIFAWKLTCMIYRFIFMSKRFNHYCFLLIFQRMMVLLCSAASRPELLLHPGTAATLGPAGRNEEPFPDGSWQTSDIEKKKLFYFQLSFSNTCVVFSFSWL